jgi:diguanylate cyclase (GGDEF)-like protein
MSATGGAMRDSGNWDSTLPLDSFIKKPTAGSAMRDSALENCDSESLRDEIARLRATIAQLEDTVIELDRLAHLDPLVGAMNRRGLMRELATMIARHDRHDSPAAVLFVDLNGLKILNDRLGHEFGDAALIHVARVLVGGVRICDCVARLGGDEFCVLLERADEASAIETAERLVRLVEAEELHFGGKKVKLSVAIGLTLVERGDNPAAVLARADRAMYRVKAAA